MERKEEPRSALLARYVLESSRISSGSVNYRAFLPPPDMELSTFNIDECSEVEIWAIGETVRTEQGKQTLYGRAEISAERIYVVGLKPLRDDSPPRHVVVVGWPDKPRWKAVAQLLAADATYVAR